MSYSSGCLASSAGLLSLAAPTREPTCDPACPHQWVRRSDADLQRKCRWHCSECGAWGWSKPGGEVRAYRGGALPDDPCFGADSRARGRLEEERKLTRDHGWRDSGAR